MKLQTKQLEVDSLDVSLSSVLMVILYLSPVPFISGNLENWNRVSDTSLVLWSGMAWQKLEERGSMETL